MNGRGDRDWGIADLADHDWLYGTGGVGEIEWTIRHGIRAHDPRTWKLASMPAFGTPRPYAAYRIDPLSPDDIRDVVEYLVSLRGQDADMAAAKRGSVIYQNKGQCFDCHATDARGDSSIGAPNLTDKVNLYGDGGRKSLVDTITQGRAGICPAWESRLTSLELREVALYVYSLSHSMDKK
jgi:cytochrome c oxidase cbb3-type subunit 3